MFPLRWIDQTWIAVSCAVVLALLSAPSLALAQAPAEGAATNILRQLEKAQNPQARLEFAKQLTALSPVPVAELKTYLARSRTSTDTERREVLASAGADVPDEKGRFKTPDRQLKKVEKTNDEFDWLTALSKLPNPMGQGDVVADVASIRALASSTAPAAGTVILEFAFSEIGQIYRDECGRYLRKMSPYSLPALIHGSQRYSHKSMQRYTTYQLERLDRQNAHKAFNSAPTEALQIAIVKAFADSQYRESIYAVLDNVDHVAPKVREATRAAWLEFTEGRAPRKPPERKLELPNGKFSEEEEPLWLDHRELAEVAIRERLLAVTGKEPNRRADLPALTRSLFAHYDHQRKAALLADFEAALKMSDPGDAIPVYDRILAQNPGFARRDEMLPTYLARAKALADADQWQQAAVLYGKASVISPDNRAAKDALQQHYRARAQNAQALGKMAKAETAMELAKEAHSPTDTPEAKTPNQVILFAGLAALVVAVILLLMGLAATRRAS